ncbi:DinB family protein [Pilimelia columellifera]|uniref:DinB family protein n=1 Tax=Pilimelia columellifera subsp. columellifera TaxID=706583 RepID=A0ABP6B309_9ACTN
MTNPDVASIYSARFEDQVTAFIEQHREMLLSYLDGLTEVEARSRLVPSKTTLLGLIKHAAFVEGVWFGEAATGQTREELGLVQTPDESFELTNDDTIESVCTAYREAVDLSRVAVAGRTGDDIFPGNRRGPLPLRWIYLHVLRELAQHCGHAEILREQVVARRTR